MMGEDQPTLAMFYNNRLLNKLHVFTITCVTFIPQNRSVRNDSLIQNAPGVPWCVVYIPRFGGLLPGRFCRSAPT